MSESLSERTGMRPHVAVWQAAIKAIGAIAETQRLVGGLNFSRDLYPARVVIDAFRSAEDGDSIETAEQSLKSIGMAVEQHFAYPGVEASRKAQQSIDLNLEKLERRVTGTRVEVEGSLPYYFCGNGVADWRQPVDDAYGDLCKDSFLRPILRAAVAVGQAVVVLPGEEQ